MQLVFTSGPKGLVVEIRYASTLDEYAEGNRLLLLNKGGVQKLKYYLYIRFAFVVGPILIAASVAIFLLGGTRHPGGIGSIVVFSAVFGGGVGWLFNPWWHRRKLARRFNELKGSAECVVTANEDGISFARVDGTAEGRLSWSIFDKADESKRVFALFPNRGQCVFLPKRSMNPLQQEEFRALVAAHLPGPGQ
jgi:hypothetical protein